MTDGPAARVAPTSLFLRAAVSGLDTPGASNSLIPTDRLFSMCRFASEMASPYSVARLLLPTDLPLSMSFIRCNHIAHHCLSSLGPWVQSG